MKKSMSAAKKPAKIVKKTVSVIMAVILTAVSVLAVWVLIDKFVLGSYAPRIFGYSILNVSSGSMEQEIKVNDLIIIKKTDDYQVNDIVTYLKDGDDIPVTHRIIKITPEGLYITKGDANNTEDRFPVEKDEILGEVVRIKEGAGIKLVWLQSQGWMYILGVIILLTIGSIFLDVNDEEKDEDKQ